jgi:hypothetical protein
MRGTGGGRRVRRVGFGDFQGVLGVKKGWGGIDGEVSAWDEVFILPLLGDLAGGERAERGLTAGVEGW